MAKWSLKGQVRHLSEFVSESDVHAWAERVESDLEKDPSTIKMLRPVEGVSTEKANGALAAVQLALTVSCLGIRLMSIGVLSVLQDRQDGWQRFRQGVRYCLWAGRVEVDWLDNILRPKDGRRQSDRNSTTCCFLAAIGLDEFPSLVEWWGERMLQALHPEERYVLDWENSPIEQFSVRLFAKWRGRRLPSHRLQWPDSAAYQKVLDDWEDDGAFAAAVVGICDYHQSNCNYGSGKIRTFDSWPFQAFPAEVLALLRVRADAGLSVPAIDHVLIRGNPLAAPPPKTPLPPDERWDRILAHCRAAYPEVPLVADEKGVRNLS